MNVLRIPSVLLALSCVVIGATVMPTALGCQVAASSGADQGTHECCKGKAHGAACPLSTATKKNDPACPVMQGCDTDDGLLMQLLGQAGFLREPRTPGPVSAPMVDLLVDVPHRPRAAALALEPPPPRV